MAGPGVPGPMAGAGDPPSSPTPIGERETGVTPGFVVGDYENAVWYQFTPPRSGVVAVDLYQTTVAGSMDQASVEAYSDTLYDDAPGWLSLYPQIDWGGPEEYLQRTYGIVEAGVPVVFDVYGYVWEGEPSATPVDVRVRISEVLTIPDDEPWVETPILVTRDIQHPGVIAPDAMLGIDGPAATGVDLRSVGGVRQLLWDGVAEGAGTGREFFGSLFQTARLGGVDALGGETVVAESEIPSSSSTAAMDLGWSAQQNSGTTKAFAHHWAAHLAPWNISAWAWSSLGGSFSPVPDDTENELTQLGGFFEGVTIKSIEFAPDTWDLNATRTTRGSGPMKFAILPARQIGAAPNRWGPSPIGPTTGVVLNEAGPESLLSDPEAQVITWNPTASATWTPVSNELMEHFLQPLTTDPLVDQAEERLLIFGTTEALASDANPMPDPYPMDTADATLQSYDAGYPNTEVHLKVTFARVYRRIPKPPIPTLQMAGRLKGLSRRFITP